MTSREGICDELRRQDPLRNIRETTTKEHGGPLHCIERRLKTKFRLQLISCPAGNLTALIKTVFTSGGNFAIPLIYLKNVLEFSTED